jgi:hypothetical protein
MDDERKEDTYPYRLGHAIGLLRRLLGEFGSVDEIDRAMAREFVDKEEKRTRDFIAGLAERG